MIYFSFDSGTGTILEILPLTKVTSRSSPRLEKRTVEFLSSPESTSSTAPAANPACKALTTVNSLESNLWLVIAFHSPNALLETGLRMCPPEKGRDSDRLRRRAVRSLRSDLFRDYRETRATLRISEAEEPTFSAAQTAWRRERDSNPRYGFPYSGFQDHRLKPLGHPSTPCFQ